MLNGRKNIGIILFDITGYYQQQLVHTLSKTASKRGYNLLTFSAFTIYTAAIQKMQQVNITFSI